MRVSPGAPWSQRLPQSRVLPPPTRLAACIGMSRAAAAAAQAYKLRQVQSTFIKPESGRLMLVLHVS